MRRMIRIFGAALSTMLVAGAPAAFADQYPRNWRVKSTDLPAPLYDFLPGHNGRMVTGGAAAQRTTPAANAPVKYDFTPGSSNFHRTN